MLLHCIIINNPNMSYLTLQIIAYIGGIYNSSSTAQGGGGSFKNRKPIGEIVLLWVTDGRAKPLMDRQVVEVSSLFLSFFLFLFSD